MYSQAQPGEIWATRIDVWVPSLRQRVPVGDIDLVLVVGGEHGSADGSEPDVRVVPLSPRAQLASSEDIVLLPNQTGVGRPLLAEVWNSRPALSRNLVKYVARVDASAFARVIELERSLLQGQPSVGDGPEITDETDPRLVFQAEEAKRFEYLSGPVLDLLATIERERAVAARIPVHISGHSGFVGHVQPGVRVDFGNCVFLYGAARDFTLAERLSPFVGSLEEGGHDSAWRGSDPYFVRVLWHRYRGIHGEAFFESPQAAQALSFALSNDAHIGVVDLQAREFA